MMQKKQKVKILFVDSDKSEINIFLECFGHRYNILPATTSENALTLFKNHADVGVVLTEQNMPDMSGIELLEQIHQINNDVAGIVITTSMDISDILDAVNKGRIFHYILKPWSENQLRIILDQVCNLWQTIQENELIREKLLNNNKILTVENVKLKSSEDHLHHLAGHLLSVHEEERNRISMKLQHDVGVLLETFKDDMKTMKQLLFQGKESEMEIQFDTLWISLNTLISKVRRLSTSLNLGIIDDLGLDDSLEKLIEKFSHHYRLTCSFNGIEINQFFSSQRQRLIYRLFQEALSNIAKHAEASTISIDMQDLDGEIIIRISDNGKGFSVTKVLLRSAEFRGIGLSAMSERARMLAGEMDILSKPGKGTSLIFTLPVDTSKEQPSQEKIDGNMQFC